MTKHPEWVMDPKDFPVWQAPNNSRRLNVLVSEDTCAAKTMAAVFFWLHPGHETDPDIHPNSPELYYVVSGEAKLVMDGEEYRVKKGMTVYIPAGVVHQSFNDGDEDLCYFYAFAPPPSEPSKVETQGWHQVKFR